MTAALSITDVISSLCDKAVGGAPEIENRRPPFNRPKALRPPHPGPYWRP